MNFFSINKKIVFLLPLVLLSSLSYGQVEIISVGSQSVNSTPNPLTTLDVRAKNDIVTSQGNVDAKDGVLVPRVTSLSVNGTAHSQLVYLVADNGGFTKGFHYWNANLTTPAWVPLNTITEPWFDSGSIGNQSNSLSGNKYINGMVGINTTDIVNSTASTPYPSKAGNVLKVDGTMQVSTIPAADYDTKYQNTTYLLPLYADANGNVMGYQGVPQVKAPGGSNTQIITQPFTLAAGAWASSYSTIDAASWGTNKIDILCYDTVTKHMYSLKLIFIDDSNINFGNVRVIQDSNTNSANAGTFVRSNELSTDPPNSIGSPGPTGGNNNTFTYTWDGSPNVSIKAHFFTNSFGGGGGGQIQIKNTGTNACVYQIKADKVF